MNFKQPDQLTSISASHANVPLHKVIHDAIPTRAIVVEIHRMARGGLDVSLKRLHL